MTTWWLAASGVFVRSGFSVFPKVAQRKIKNLFSDVQTYLRQLVSWFWRMC
jgi:hypothetical protein